MENIKMKPVWPKSKEEIWDEVFENIGEQELPKTFLKRIPIWGYVAGLTVAVLLACYFYTVTEEARRGEHSTVKLPDHSTVTLNAATKLSYRPLAWFFSRKVDLEGEAYFDVKLGVSCSADRNIKAKINQDGIWIEKLDDHPGRLIPESLRQAGEGNAVKIDLNRPMAEILEQLDKYPVSTRLSLSGTIIVGRDIAHAKLKERIDKGEGLPQYIKDHPIYYAGPAKTPKGMSSGSSL